MFNKDIPVTLKCFSHDAYGLVFAHERYASSECDFVFPDL